MEVVRERVVVSSPDAEAERQRKREKVEYLVIVTGSFGAIGYLGHIELNDPTRW